MILSLVIILSQIPTLITPTVYTLSIYRCIFGFASGAIITCANLILVETVPKHKQEVFSTSINFGVILGIMICLFCGLPLTTMTPEQAKETNLWMITYSIPIAISTANLILFFTVFTEEPI